MTIRHLKSVMVLTCMVAFFFTTKAAVVYQYGFENLPGNGNAATSPWTGTPDVLATGLSNSSWATNYSSGFISYAGSCGTSACQALSISGNNEPATTTYTLTFTVGSGYALNITDLSFWNRESTDGPTTAKITINGTTAFNSLTLAGTTGANTGTLTPATSFTNLTGTFTLVFTLKGATSASGTFRLDDFVIDGSVTTTSVINAYNVTGGGSLCAGNTGVAIGLANSDTGVTYQLQNSAYTNIGAPVAGTGSAISFGPQTTAGTYIVEATNNTTSDTALMTGNAIVVVNAPPTVNLGAAVTQCGGTATLNAGNAGSTFLWSDNTTQETDVVSSTATYSVTVTNTNTCSASASVSVTINTPPTISFTGSTLNVCSGQQATIIASGATTYLWSNSLTTATITVQPGTSTPYSVTGTTNNCTATGTATVNVSSAITNSITMQICQGQSYLGHNTSATFNDTLLAAGGCDSIVTVTLQVLPVITTSASQTICAGQSYQGHTTGGTFSDTLTTITGCDSIVTLTLTVTAPVTSSASQTICAGQSYQGHTTGGTFSDTLTTITGCDSIVTLTLTVTAPVTSSASQTICAGQSYQGHSASGTFTDTLTTITGCDSVVTLTLTVTAPVIGGSTTQTICSGQSYDGYTASGTYNDTLQSVSGCDSIVTLHLTVLPPITLALSHSMCKYDTFMGYTTSGNYKDTLQAANGCDSIVYLQLTVNALPHVTLYLTFDTVCNNAAPIVMSGGLPAGGYYSGQGISNSQFVPSSAPLGYDTIYYNYTDSNGCFKDRYEFAYTISCTDSTDTTITPPPTGIKNISNTLFQILPNPTQDYLTIENASSNTPYSLSLYDLLGRLVIYQPEINNLSGKATLDLRQLPAGLYLLNITDGNGIVSGFKIVKD